MLVSAHYSVALGKYCEELAWDKETKTKQGRKSIPPSLWITPLALFSGFCPWIPFWLLVIGGVRRASRRRFRLYGLVRIATWQLSVMLFGAAWLWCDPEIANERPFWNSKKFFFKMSVSRFSCWNKNCSSRAVALLVQNVVKVWHVNDKPGCKVRL